MGEVVKGGSVVDLKVDDWKQAALSLLQQEIDRLKVIAHNEVDDFWVEHYKVRKAEPFKEWGVLGVRVREYKFSFGIEWYINRFHGERGKRVMFSKSLRMAKTKMRYGFLDCQGTAKEWEVCLALEKEELFSEIRKKLVKLNMMRRSITAY